jgi:glycosyltransferase involved in cell wall biosynthesis
VPWESILCGTPVIVAAGSGAEEWVAGAKAGAVVPYGNPGEIAEAVNRFDPAAAAEELRRGRTFWEKRLAWPQVTTEMLKWYDKIIR